MLPRQYDNELIGFADWLQELENKLDIQYRVLRRIEDKIDKLKEV